MLHILDDAVRQGDGTPSVRIGRENDAAELAGVSVVASRYAVSYTHLPQGRAPGEGGRHDHRRARRRGGAAARLPRRQAHGVHPVSYTHLAVTTKGVSLNGWEGNATPRIAETPSGMLNSIGLQNPGVAHLKEHDLPWLAERGATTIVNVSGHSFDEYVQVIEALEDAPVDAYEVNISCPNVDAGGMTIGLSLIHISQR